MEKLKTKIKPPFYNSVEKQNKIFRFPMLYNKRKMKREIQIHFEIPLET